MSRKIALAFCFATILGWHLLQPAAAQQAASQEADQGRRLYMTNNCYLCHGTVGQGGAGPTLAPPTLRPESNFSAYVRHPAGTMPPYTTAVLSDADLDAIHGYLQSLPAPPPQLPRLLSESSAPERR
jgi:ubiquinol-cytochrome c reductase cytochrome c subunit